MDEARLFAGHSLALSIHRAVRAAVETIGEAEVRVTKSQAGFRRRRPFAATWRPGQHLKGRGAPLVLSVYLRRRDDWPRWKEVVEPSPGRFTHHLELNAPEDVDAEVRERLAEAWCEAG